MFFQITDLFSVMTILILYYCSVQLSISCAVDRWAGYWHLSGCSPATAAVLVQKVQDLLLLMLDNLLTAY